MTKIISEVRKLKCPLCGNKSEGKFKKPFPKCSQCQVTLITDQNPRGRKSFTNYPTDEDCMITVRLNGGLANKFNKVCSELLVSSNQISVSLIERFVADHGKTLEKETGDTSVPENT
jgi:late competence protein required for DNA uptake (superfamily II DNA/RNA helicase)